MKKMLVMFTMLLVSLAVVSAERSGDIYEHHNVFTTSAVTICDTATEPSQCAEGPFAAAVDFVMDTMLAQGAIEDADCGDILVLSSGNPADTDTTLSTNMLNPGCGLNPDGFTTFDCVDLSYTAPVDSVILAISSEYPEFLTTTFTDWMRIGGILDISIDDWVGDPTLVSMPTYGPDESGSVTLSTIGAGSTVDLRVADSGDEIYDTALIVVPVNCFEGNQETVLCGNGNVDPGEECDDGNKVNNDGCSSICLIEDTSVPEIPEFTTLGALVGLSGISAYLFFKKKH